MRELSQDGRFQEDHSRACTRSRRRGETCNKPLPPAYIPHPTEVESQRKHLIDVSL